MENIISADERQALRLLFWRRLHTNLAVFLEWEPKHIALWGTEAETINGEAVLILHALCHAWLTELGAGDNVLCKIGTDVESLQRCPLVLRPDVED